MSIAANRTMIGLRMRSLRCMIGRLNIKAAIQRFVSRRAEQQAFRAALMRAYTGCGRHDYSTWSTFFLDPEFQVVGAEYLQRCYLRQQTRPSAAELADLWAGEALAPWLRPDIKQRYTAELVEVASGFLCRLETELRAEQVL